MKGFCTEDDIILRDDLDGSFEIDAPSLPAPPSPSAEEEEEEARRRLLEGWRKMGDNMLDHAGKFTSPQEFLKYRDYMRGVAHVVFVALWREVYPDGNWRRMANARCVDVEIKAVLMASLEEKVQSLEEDGWMFGDEEKDEDQ